MAAAAAVAAAEPLDEEELAYEYDELCDEVCDLASELRASALEARQMRVRLQAAMRTPGGSGGGATAGPGAAPPLLPGVSALPVEEDRRLEDLHGLLRWLAEHADLGRQEVLDVGFEVPIGGRAVQLLRIVQWPLTTALNGQLRLSVPIEHREALAGLLTAAKAQGSLAPEVLRAFAADWDLVTGDLLAATQVTAEPSVLLAHRRSPQGILVARWPTREALAAFCEVRAAGAGLPRVGDRVEVEYEGHWYAGVLHCVDASGRAGVRCDVDAPGVITIALLHRLRRLAAAPAAQVPVPAAAATATASGASPGAERRAGPGHRRTRSSAL